MSNKVKRMSGYLIQRGIINRYGNEYNTYSVSDFVGLEYMGHAEYEFGTIGNSLRYIAKEKDTYSLVKTDIVNPNKKTLYIFAPKEYLENIKETFKYHIEGSRASSLGHNNIYNAFVADSNGEFAKTDFWWEIEQAYIGFLGDEKTAESFMAAFNNSAKRIEAAKNMPKEEIEKMAKATAKESKENEERLSASK